MMLRVVVELIASIIDASMVDLPDPLRPVTRSRPRGENANSRTTAGSISSSMVGTSTGTWRSASAGVLRCMKMLARNRASPETPNAKSISLWVEKYRRCRSLRSWLQTSRSSCAGGGGSSRVYSTPSTRTIGAVPAFRCRSLARDAIIFSSTLRIFMTAPRGNRSGWRSGRFDQEQLLSVFDRLRVLDQDLDDGSAHFRLDLVHQLHRFDDADGLSDVHPVADLDVRVGIRRGRPIECPHHRRRDRDGRARRARRLGPCREDVSRRGGRGRRARRHRRSRVGRAKRRDPDRAAAGADFELADARALDQTDQPPDFGDLRRSHQGTAGIIGARPRGLHPFARRGAATRATLARHFAGTPQAPGARADSFRLRTPGSPRARRPKRTIRAGTARGPRDW